MTAFDLGEVVRQGQCGVVPPEWTLFPLLRRAVWSNLISYLLLGLFLVGAALYLIGSGQAFVPSFLSDSFFTPGGIAAASLLEASLLVALGTSFLFLGMRWLDSLRKPHAYFLVVTPEGFAEVKEQKVVGIAFAEVADLRLRNGVLGQEVVVRRRSGGSLTFAIGKNYGPPRDVYVALVADLPMPRWAVR